MAGSLKWFFYTSDRGQQFGIFMDESNGNAVGNADVTGGVSAAYGLPRSIVPRKAIYKSQDLKITRSIPLSLPTAAPPAGIAVINGQTGSSVNLNLISIRGEKERRVVGFDTGQDDGSTD